MDGVVKVREWRGARHLQGVREAQYEEWRFVEKRNGGRRRW